MPRHYSTAQSAMGLAVLSLLSPVAGILVEIAVAWRFGTSAPVDAFRIAVAVVYIGQQLFIGSLFPNVIVPLFAKYRSNGDEIEAWQTSISLANLVAIPTVFMSVALFVWPAQVAWVLAPGLGAQARLWTVFFVRWFGLCLIPLLYSGAGIAILYTEHIFWAGTAAQLASNIVLGATILVLGGALMGPASIAVGVLLAATAFLLLSVAVLTPVFRRMSLTGLKARKGIWRTSVREGVRLGIPLLTLPLVNQAIGVVALWSLSAASVGTIAALGYAGKLMRMASLLPDVIATVLFPKFAALARNSNPIELRELATRAMRMALFISLAIACTLFALRVPLVGLLFHHGAFSETAVRRVGRLFGFFLIGMPAGILSFYLAKVLYALEDTWWPTRGVILSMVFAGLVMPPAAEKFGAFGVAATYAGISWLGALVPAYALHSKYAGFDGRALGVFALKILPPAAGAAWLGGAIAHAVPGPSASATLTLTLEFVSGAIVASVSYWLAAIIGGVPEALEITRFMRWQSAPVLRTIKAAICG